MRARSYYVYIIANHWVTVLYIGVTNDLMRRIGEHKNAVKRGFSQRYHLTELMYYEEFDDIGFAIGREKQLKRWHRDWKINLIKQSNPKLLDLAKELYD
jgi:putative endonuclease